MNDQELRNGFREAFDARTDIPRLEQTLASLPARSKIQLLLSYPVRRLHLSRLATNAFIAGVPVVAVLALVLALGTNGLRHPGRDSGVSGRPPAGWTGYGSATAGPLTNVPQDITFSGAVSGHWSEATVTQCEVQMVGGSAPAVPIYQVFMKAPLGGVTYYLTIGLINYGGPRPYSGQVAAPPQAVVIHPTAGPTAVAGSPLPSSSLGVRVTRQSGVTLASLYAGSTKTADGLSEVDDPNPARVTVSAGQDQGTIDATFAKWQLNQAPPPSPPPPSARIHVTGSWNCGAFPISPPRPSPSPRLSPR